MCDSCSNKYRSKVIFEWPKSCAVCVLCLPVVKYKYTHPLIFSSHSSIFHIVSLVTCSNLLQGGLRNTTLRLNQIPPPCSLMPLTKPLTSSPRCPYLYCPQNLISIHALFLLSIPSTPSLPPLSPPFLPSFSSSPWCSLLLFSFIRTDTPSKWVFSGHLRQAPKRQGELILFVIIRRKWQEEE